METQQAMWAFQSMVRHKLNTPMHGMASCLDLLASQPAEEVDPEELNELIGWTKEAMHRLEKSVTSVLRHTRAPELVQWDSCFALSQLEEVLAGMTSSIDLMPASVTFEAGTQEVTVRISQAALECIFTEFFENSKKFHPRHDPRISIVVKKHEPNNCGDALRIIIADDGIHLSPTQLEKMWMPYYQGERSFTGEVPGMGLGLALVRSLLWQVGGACSATNRADAPGIAQEIILPLVGKVVASPTEEALAT
jgi:K+-sensing histidine kinase KdpD